MNLIKFAISSAFVTGALTAGAIMSGIIIGNVTKKKDLVNNLKKMSIKKNKAASTKDIDN